MEIEPTNEKASRIAFLCQVFYPDYSSTSQLYTDLLTELSKHNKEIKVICGYPALVESDVPIQKKEIHEGINIHRVGVRVNYRRNIFLRALHYLAFIFGAMRVLFSIKDYDRIIALTNPPILPAFLRIMSKIIRFRYVLLLCDVFPEALVALGKWKENSHFVRLYKALNKAAYHNADKVFTVGRDMRDLIIRDYDVPAQRVTHFPEWSSFEPAKSINQNPYETNLCSKLDLKGKFIVQYSGNMALAHDMGTLVRAAKHLNNQPDIAFVIIGGGMRLAEAKKLADELGVTNIHWLPFQPKEELGDSLACCHLSLISLRKGFGAISAPCKIYGILASGRGVLAMVPKVSETARIVQEAKCGLVMEPDDDEALAGTILDLFSDRAKVMEMGRRAYREYKSKYTLDAAVQTAIKLWG